MTTTTAAPAAAEVRTCRLTARVSVTAATALLGAILLGALTGPAELAWRAVLTEIAGRLPVLTLGSTLSETQQALLWRIRIPRVVLAGIVGASLAASGAAYQGVFRNPLADPFLLGVAAGAGLGVTLAIAGGIGTSGLTVPGAAFVGALLAVLATYTLGRSVGGRSPGTLILAGVAVASFLTAIQTYVLQRNTDSLREVYVWILGRLSTAGWGDVLVAVPYALPTLLVILLHRRLLDVMAVGEREADTLGVNAARVRITLVLAATLATAAAVAVSGLIGFVGIIVPHAVRLVAGSSYRIVLPLSLVAGAAFLIVADVLARALLSPAELPIGVVTAFVGAPFFTLVLRAGRRAAL